MATAILWLQLRSASKPPERWRVGRRCRVASPPSPCDRRCSAGLDTRSVDIPSAKRSHLIRSTTRRSIFASATSSDPRRMMISWEAALPEAELPLPPRVAHDGNTRACTAPSPSADDQYRCHLPQQHLALPRIGSCHHVRGDSGERNEEKTETRQPRPVLTVDALQIRNPHRARYLLRESDSPKRASKPGCSHEARRALLSRWARGDRSCWQIYGDASGLTPQPS